MNFVDSREVRITLDEDERTALRKIIVVLDEIKKKLCELNAQGSHLAVQDEMDHTSYYDYFELDDAAILLDELSTKLLVVRED